MNRFRTIPDGLLLVEKVKDQVLSARTGDHEEGPKDVSLAHADVPQWAFPSLASAATPLAVSPSVRTDAAHYLAKLKGHMNM